MPDLILASTSPSRLRLFEQAGIAVRAVASGIDEASVNENDPRARARALAQKKAEAVARRFPSAWVLGADQVVTDGREIWGKPTDPEDHLRRLAAMRGRWHDLITGFALLGPGFQEVGDETTRMWVRSDITDVELESYVRTGEGSACAGGYAAEGRGMFLFSRIDGDWFNVLGLPMLRVIDALREHGWRFEWEQLAVSCVTSQ